MEADSKIKNIIKEKKHILYNESYSKKYCFVFMPILNFTQKDY